jgi:hypothetical protein
MANQVVTYANNNPWTVPNNCYLVHVEARGGAGGGGANNNNNNNGAGGGGGGAYARSNNIPVTPGASLTMVVGAGGDAGNNSNNGNNGTGSGFNNNQVYARFGLGGNRAGNTTATLGAGGTIGNNNNSGNGCIGQVCFAGGNGANKATGNSGGGGGASGSNNNTGNAATSQTGATGQGGGGSGGAGGGNNANGTNGTVPGGGGGGSGAFGLANKHGGNGAAGTIILTWTPGYSLSAATGAATSTGTASTPRINRKVNAATGAATSTGTASTPRINRKVNAATGAATSTGVSVPLTKGGGILGTKLGPGNSCSLGSAPDRQSGKTVYFWFCWDGTSDVDQIIYTEQHATSDDGLMMTSGSGVVHAYVDGVSMGSYAVTAGTIYGCAMVWSGGTCTVYIWLQGTTPSAAYDSHSYGAEASTGCVLGAA